MLRWVGVVGCVVVGRNARVNYAQPPRYLACARLEGVCLRTTRITDPPLIIVTDQRLYGAIE